MIRAARVSVKMNIVPLLEGKVAISSAQLFGAHFQLYKSNADAQPNFQFLLDSLASKDTTSHTPLDIQVNSLIVRHTSVAYDQLDQPETEGQFNMSHLRLQDISAYPFSIGWSEGNRMWDYSVLFGKDLYDFPQDQTIPAYIDIGRQSLWGLIYLLPKVNIVMAHSPQPSTALTSG